MNYPLKFSVNKGAAWIAFLNAVSFIVAVLPPTLVDERRTFSILGGWSEYPLGICVALTALPLFAISYLLLIRVVNVFRKAAGCFLGSLVFLILASANFRPLSNLWILVWGITYSFAVAVVAFFHWLPVNLRFLGQNEIPLQARIEKVKLDFNVWFSSIVLLVTIAGALSAALIPRIHELASAYAAGVSSPMVIETAIWVSLIYLLSLIWAVGGEFFGKLLLLSEALLVIRRGKDRWN